jgi:ligand-binding sensor domain-containing protein/two-component sensor histidine kinase
MFQLLSIITSAFFIIVLINGDAFGQRVERFNIYKYTANEGLSGQNIRKFLCDRYGFLWIATQEGLSRFDGRSFKNYTTDSKKIWSLSSIDVRDMEEDSIRSLLWVLTGEALDCINTRTGEVISSQLNKSDAADEWNICLKAVANEIWIGTFKGLKIFDIPTKTFVKLPVNRWQKGIHGEVRHLVTDKRGNMWAFFSAYGLRIFNTNTKKVIRQVPNELFADKHADKIRFLASANVNNGQFLLASNDGLKRIKYDANYNLTIDKKPSNTLDRITQQNVYSISSLLRNEVLISSPAGLFRTTSNLQKISRISVPIKGIENDWLKSIFDIYIDGNSNVWLGCQEGFALLSNNKSAFDSYFYDSKTNTKLDDVRCLFTKKGSNIIYAGLGNGYAEINTSDHSIKKKILPFRIENIFEDPFGRLQLSYSKGILVLDKKKVYKNINIYPEFQRYRTSSVNSQVKIGDSVLVMGTENDNGLLVWNFRKRIVHNVNVNTSPKLAANIVNTIYRDKKGSVWVLSDKVITRLNASLTSSTEIRYRNVKRQQYHDIFFDICEANGFFWVAAYGTGILQVSPDFKLKQVFSVKDGLSNSGVYKVFPVGDTALLISSNNGLSVMDLRTKKFKSYFEIDGLSSNNFEEASGLMLKNKIYIGGIKGFTIVNPQLFKLRNIVPKIYFNNISILTAHKTIDTSDLEIKSVRVPSNAIQTSVAFSAIEFDNISRSHFAYRILDQDTNWVGIGTRNRVDITGLSPGHYSLQVTTIDESGKVNIIKTLELVFLPKWYRGIWAKIIFICMLGTLLLSLFKYRISQLKREHMIKAEIASDLHDDIGGTLNSVRIFTVLAIAEKDNMELLNNIQTHLDNAIIALRDVLWVLDDKKDTVAALVNRLEQQLNPTCQVIAVRLSFWIQEHVDNIILSKVEKRNLYYMLKEALNNSIKYSKAKEIKIHIKGTKKTLSIWVRDNGVGFDRSQVSSGNGLKNIESRSRQINYRFKICASPGKGTFLKLKKVI